MKHFLPVAAFLITGTPVFSQITIDQNDFPAGGDTALISLSDDLTLDILSTGANTIWNYSNLHITSQRIDTFHNVSSASFLYQLQYNNVILDPDHAADYYSNLIGFDFGGVGGGGITIDKPVSFTQVNSSSVKNVGIGVVLNGYEIPMSADTIDTEYALPMTYSDSWNSNSYIYVDLNPAFNGIFIRHQQRSSEVDGWGTVSTPYGTFDAVRVRSELNYNDSVYVDLGFGGTWLQLPTPNEVHYTWWSSDNKVPVLKVVAQVIAGNETVTRVEFKDYERNLAGIESEEITLARIFPNPANQNVNLLLDNSVKQVAIYSVSGELVYQNTVSGNSLQIDVQSWSPGMYMVQLTGENSVESTRLIIE